MAVCLLIAVAAEAADLTVKAEMKQVVEPASNVLFSVGGDADPANGPDALKVPGERWKAAADAALQLKEVAAKLNDAGRAKWRGFVRDFADESTAALAAANAKDGAALSTAANALSDTCSACHAKYKPQMAD
jgi:cytochrome c556